MIPTAKCYSEEHFLTTSCKMLYAVYILYTCTVSFVWWRV